MRFPWRYSLSADLGAPGGDKSAVMFSRIHEDGRIEVVGRIVTDDREFVREVLLRWEVSNGVGREG